MTDLSFRPDPSRRNWRHALSAPLEIALVMGASLAAALWIMPQISPGLADALGLTGSPRDLMAGAWALTQQFGVQYGVLAGLALVFALLRGRRSAPAYALATPTPKITHPVRYGLLLGLLISIIPSTVFILQDIAPIGADTPIWAALRDAPWDLDFWVFMAVGSFALVPLLEELGWRSYVLGRFLEGAAPGAALVATTALFALLHVQYLQADAAMMATFIGLVVGSVGLGFATLRAGTIWPAVIAHIMINFPLTTEGHAIRIGLAVIALIVWRKPIGSELVGLVRVLWRTSTLLALPLVMAVAAPALAMMIWPSGLPVIAATLAGLALGGGLIRRSAWARPKS